MTQFIEVCFWLYTTATYVWLEKIDLLDLFNDLQAHPRTRKDFPRFPGHTFCFLSDSTKKALSVIHYKVSWKLYDVNMTSTQMCCFELSLDFLFWLAFLKSELALWCGAVVHSTTPRDWCLHDWGGGMQDTRVGTNESGVIE